MISESNQHTVALTWFIATTWTRASCFTRVSRCSRDLSSKHFNISCFSFVTHILQSSVSDIAVPKWQYTSKLTIAQFIYISKNTKMHLYTSTAIPSAIYASETWRTTDKTNRILNVFNRRCLRDIMGVSWNCMSSKNRITNAAVGDLQDAVAASQRRFIGH